MQATEYELYLDSLLQTSVPFYQLNFNSIYDCPSFTVQRNRKKWFQILGFDLHLPEVPGLTPQYSDKQMFSPYS